jgi:Domain of unknown function (DUF1707)
VDTSQVVGHTVAAGKLDDRLSDAERQVVQLLRDGFADGRLTLDELHDRLDLAHGATTRGDAAPLTVDPRATARRDAETPDSCACPERSSR